MYENRNQLSTMIYDNYNKVWMAWQNLQMEYTLSINNQISKIFQTKLSIKNW